MVSPALESTRAVDLTERADAPARTWVADGADVGQADERLMCRVQANDSQAFDELYGRHFGAALAVARSICHSRGLAEEAVQDGFLSIWHARDTYRPPGSASFRGWAMEIVRNRTIDAQRRRMAAKRPQTVEIPAAREIDSLAASPLDQVIDRDRSDVLRESMERIPDAQADVIRLAFFGAMTHAEIAEQFSLPVGTVKGRMRLGLEKLRRDLPADL